MEPILHVDGLGFSYGAAEVLRDVGLELRGGELLALLGPNGSGKSTLIRALLGMLRTRGTIVWLGRDLRRWRRRELARQVAYLPQSPAWEPQQTVGDVLKLGRAPYWGPFGIESEDDLRIVREVADLLELGKLLQRRLDEISGGQRQRVFLGRALAQRPRAMLLDEPGTFLDLRHQVYVLRLLRELVTEQGIAVLMASHDLTLSAAFADRVLVLHEGRVVAAGPAAQVLEPGLLQQVYGVPMHVLHRPGGPPIVVPDVS